MIAAINAVGVTSQDDGDVPSYDVTVHVELTVEGCPLSQTITNQINGAIVSYPDAKLTPHIEVSSMSHDKLADLVAGLKAERKQNPFNKPGVKTRIFANRLRQGRRGEILFGCRARRSACRHGQTHPPNRLRYRPAQLDLILGCAENTVYDWADVLLGRCAPEKAPLSVGGLHLLAAPLRDTPAFTPGAMHSLTAQYDAFFDDILIDAPEGSSGVSLGCQCGAGSGGRFHAGCGLRS